MFNNVHLPALVVLRVHTMVLEHGGKDGAPGGQNRLVSGDVRVLHFEDDIGVHFADEKIGKVRSQLMSMMTGWIVKFFHFAIRSRTPQKKVNSQLVVGQLLAGLRNCDALINLKRR
jgi:hypothetical protein